jgi:peptidoglycan/LPS O-acetylase OafA/YrhL
MAATMQLYAGFTLVVIAILVIIVLAALASNLVRSVRRRFGSARAHDDFGPPAASSRPLPPASRKAPPAAPPKSSASPALSPRPARSGISRGGSSAYRAG